MLDCFDLINGSQSQLLSIVLSEDLIFQVHDVGLHIAVIELLKKGHLWLNGMGVVLLSVAAAATKQYTKYTSFCD